MRFLAFLIVASIALCLLRAAMLVLILLVTLSLLWAVLTKPAELTGLIGLTVLCSVVSAHPLASIVAVTLIAVLIVVRSPQNSRPDA